MSGKTQPPVYVDSEVGELEAVIIHTMGSEVENMTPQNAERALYSDILSLSVAQSEYSRFREVLKKLCKVYEVKDLLAGILKNEKVRNDIILRVSNGDTDPELGKYLMDLDSEALASHLIEGVPMRRESLSRFLDPQRFELRPLHNFFFTRDSAITLYDKVFISKMANRVRERESLIMEEIFHFHPAFNTATLMPDCNQPKCEKISIEGGDILLGGDDLMLIGIGSRTTPAGVDAVIDHLKSFKKRYHIIVQELPTQGESFIHLDMVFTFLSHDECMVYAPVILQPNRFKTIHIVLDNGKVNISEEKNIIDTMEKIGRNIKPIYCGGAADLWTQEREQWHSGANFFAVAPGKVLGYSRNAYTTEELNKNGYEVLEAEDVINGNADPGSYSKYVITIDGSELPRGGGGPRCMTMPVRRKRLN